ncbi:peptidase domain-containing ABC transporter [Pseudorhodoferax sp.]|uniref:peptidase domain-containing ABC transporter n=1 Tax=Pseudorhodoferax sp. TaxID=1993553 RepID=UPI002DD641B9|nr:peptidase domain-containing ABC transporter [Pseudorhodoferax sp.]
MTLLDYSWRRHTPVLVQTEAAECGLACLAMVAAHHGHHIDLATLRARHAVSLKGSTLTDLMRVAGALDLAPRPLRLDLDHLAQLQLPCVLHWDFNHFVVLVRIAGGQLVVHDPAVGRRVLPVQEFSRHFTGVALELRPTPAFQPRRERQRVRLAALVGRLPGLPGALGQVLLLALALQVFAIAGPFHMQWVVDQALVAHDRDLVAVLGVGFVLLALVQTGVSALRAWLLVVLGTQLNLQLMSRLLRHLLRLPMGWFEKRHVGDVMSKFDSLGVLQRTLTSSFLEALIDGVMALATLAMMLVYSPLLAAVAMTAAVLYTLLRIALYAPVRLATQEQIVRGARQQSHLLESVRGMQSIKLFGREDQRGANWQNLVVDEFNAGIRAKRLSLVYQTGQGALFGIENAVTLWLGALLVLDVANGSGFSVGMLYAFVSYKSQFMQRTAALVENLLQLRMLGLHTERVGDIAMTATEDATGPDPLAAELASVDIDIRGLAFRHAENEPLVLQDFNLRIAEGESVAIVGPSGCGKTTLVKLLLGLLQPSAGSIEIGGRPLARVGLSAWRGVVASVMQDDQLFAGSIAENICFFEPAPDHAHLEACARLAAVHEDIAAMPMQYNTLVGDMGTVLSGGQKQRILLARALYRRPRVLVLDEATSHLDIARERSVNDAVRGLRLTRIIVAHRPETIASADRVVLLGGAQLHAAAAPVRGQIGSVS